MFFFERKETFWVLVSTLVFVSLGYFVQMFFIFGAILVLVFSVLLWAVN